MNLRTLRADGEGLTERLHRLGWLVLLEIDETKDTPVLGVSAHPGELFQQAGGLGELALLNVIVGQYQMNDGPAVVGQLLRLERLLSHGGGVRIVALLGVNLRQGRCYFAVAQSRAVHRFQVLLCVQPITGAVGRIGFRETRR